MAPSNLVPAKKTVEKTIKVYRLFNFENEYLDPVLDEQKLTYEGVADGARADVPLRYYEYFDMDAMSKAIDSIRYSFPKFYKKTAIFINLLLFFFGKA
ncbi:MAG: hypothetical protein J6O18_05215 [Bacilli bacterium]|nr:hypothetical protein [Bacilli bacterium]